MSTLPLPPGMPLVRVLGRPLSPPFSALVLGNQNLVAVLGDRHVPPLTAADVAGVAFMHALHRLSGDLSVDLVTEAAEVVLALHPTLARAAGWLDHRLLAARSALRWLQSPSAAHALRRAEMVAWEALLIPDAWQQAAQAKMGRAFAKTARKIARLRRWQQLDVDAALALGELPMWRDAHGYGRVAVLKALEPARLPGRDGARTERLGRKRDATERLLDHAANPEAVARLRTALKRLSPRERELVALLANGYNEKEAAERLGVRPGTVWGMVARLKKKVRPD